jgi:uncharacterized protein (TIGR00369 family)
MPTRPEMGTGQASSTAASSPCSPDSSMGRAMSTVLPDGERHHRFDLETSFISSGRIGEPLEAVGTVLHSGRRTGVAERRVTGGDGRLVATASATFIAALPAPWQE